MFIIAGLIVQVSRWGISDYIFLQIAVFEGKVKDVVKL